jgi:hypothetical protein
MEKSYIPNHLENEYLEYREIIETIPEEETRRVFWYSDIAADMKKKALEKLPASACQREIDLAIQKSRFITVNAQENELAIRGFSSNILRLFEVLDSSEEIDTETEQRIEVYRKIPQEKRKAAKLYSNSGYYYGGNFNWIEE